MELKEILEQIESVKKELDTLHHNVFYFSGISINEKVDTCTKINSSIFWLNDAAEKLQKQHETQIQNTKRPQGGDTNPEVVLG